MTEQKTDSNEQAGLNDGGDNLEREMEQLLQEVQKYSRSVFCTVTNYKGDAFVGKSLASFLRLRGLEPHTNPQAPESIVANARLLIAFISAEKSGSVQSPQLRHAFLRKHVNPQQLKDKFLAMKDAYVPQPLDYGRNSRYGDKWRISCYVVVKENWKPKIEAHQPMVNCMEDIMNECVLKFTRWYRNKTLMQNVKASVMNAFVTRYTPREGEDQLERHIDGSDVDGSVILALPTDDPFEGGILRVWEGRGDVEQEFQYEMEAGDVIFLDNRVWHQAMPITSGTRWALVLFLQLRNPRRNMSSGS